MRPRQGINKITVLYYLIFMGFLTFIVACGANGDKASPTSAATGDAPQLTSPSAHGGGVGWGNKQCFLCHPVTELQSIHSFGKTLAASFEKLDSDETGVCLYCHGSNGITGITADTYECTRCHKDSSIVAKADLFDGSDMHDVDGDGKLSNSDCVVCHSYSDMNGTMDVTADLTQSSTTYADTTDFCLNCHDGNGAFGVTPPSLTYDTEYTNIYSTFMGEGSTSAERKSTADIHGYADGSTQAFGVFRGSYTNGMTVPCMSCHESHSSDNTYMIAKTGANATLADSTAQSASISVTDNNFTQLCAVCHMSTDGAATDNGLQEVTHASGSSSDCTSCHYHGAGHGTSVNGLF